MRVIFLICLLLIAARAEAKSAQVILRDKEFRPKIAAIELPELISEERLEGKYFKIVAGDSDTAISFAADPELVRKAATTYYHLNIARAWFLRHTGAAPASPIVVRLDQTRAFQDSPEFNGSVVVRSPALELWIRPGKIVRPEVSLLKKNETARSLVATARDGARTANFENLLSNFLTGTLDKPTLLLIVGTTVTSEIALRGAIPLASIFFGKSQYLEMALVPELIYREYSRLLLADSIAPETPSTVTAGIYDYFAAAIADHPKLGEHIRRFSNLRPKNALRKKEYGVEFETREEGEEFSFSLLWQLREALGNERANLLIFRLHSLLAPGATIRGGMLESALKACDQVCESPFRDRLTLLHLFQERGI